MSTSTSGRGSTSAIRSVSSSMPSPVRADTNTARGSSPRSTRRWSVGGEVRLVERHDLRHVPGIHLADHVADRRQLCGRIRMRCVDHVDDDVGVAHLLEGGAERLHQLVQAGCGRIRRCR